MNKLGLGIASVSLAIILVGCGSKGVQECVFPDSPDVEAPGWVCDFPVDGVEVSATGSAEFSGAGHDFMKQMAATSARVQLAQRMRVQVQNMIKQFAETTGAADAETVDLVNTSVTKQITDESLVGTKIFRSYSNPTTRSLYVLVGFDETGLEAMTKAALKTSMNNEKALWQKFQAKQGQDELAADIAKMR